MKRVLRSRHDFQATTLRNQLTSLVLYEVIVTTRTQAKALEAFANHFFNVVKSGDLTAKKHAHQTLLEPNAVKKVFEEILPRYTGAVTTFVRSLAATPRSGDNAPRRAVMLIEGIKVESSTAARAADKPTSAPTVARSKGKSS